MTSESTDIRDPAAVDVESVEPNPTLGANFEVAALPFLPLSTKSRVWGDAHPSAKEPTAAAFKEGKLRQQTLSKDGHRCMFCGFYSSSNEVHNVSDNHRDIRPENLRAADALCHGWQHLGELGEGNAVMAYLPGLTGQDVNHLQRTIMVALQTGDDELQSDAKKLLNWMASHRNYAKNAWGTSEPTVFAEAVIRLDDLGREKRQVVFRDLAVVFNPGPYSQQVRQWAGESYRTLPASRWGQVYHDVMNSPA